MDGAGPRLRRRCAACKPDLVMFSMPAAGLYRSAEGRAHVRPEPDQHDRPRQPDRLPRRPPIPVENAFSDPLQRHLRRLRDPDRAAPPRPHRQGPAHRLLAAGSGHADGRPGLHGLRPERPRRRADRQPAPARRRRAARRVPVRGRGPLDQHRRASPTTSGTGWSRRWRRRRGRRQPEFATAAERVPAHRRAARARRRVDGAASTTASSPSACSATASPRRRC